VIGGQPSDTASRSWEHSTACGVFTNDDAVCTCKDDESAASRSNEPMPTYGLDRDYPLLDAKAREYDFAERLGGCTDPLMAEIDKAMRELWDARRYVSEGHPS
jgi:hypothetical protein